MFVILKKYLKLGPYGLIAALLVTLSLLLRLLLIAQNWPFIDSDEGTMGLEALHIAYHSELPVFLYGQSYMGVIEAYIGAFLYHFFGPTPFTLRLGLILLFVLFLITMYFLICYLYDKKLAIVTLLVLCLGNANTFTREVTALGGAVETLLFGALICLLTSWLVVSFQSDPRAGSKPERIPVYACLGLAMGLGFWSDSLIVPFIAISLVLLLCFCWRELFSWSALSFLLGMLIGVLPLLHYDFQNPAENIIRVTLLEHSNGGVAASSLVHYSVWLALLGTLLIDIPIATGAYPICASPAQQVQWPSKLSCMGFQGIWGTGIVLLWIIATVVLLSAFYRAVRRRKQAPPQSARQEIARLACRLGLLGTVFCTVGIYAWSPAPALVPFTSQRYLIGLLVATPAVLAPLLSPPAWSQRIPAFLLKVVGRLTLIFLLSVLLFGTLNVFFQQVPALQASNQQQSKLIHGLLAMHATDIYSDYWTCDRLIFQSDEQIICAVVDGQLRPAQNRYLPYLKTVQQDPDASYVFATGSAGDRAVTRLVAHSSRHFRRSVFAGFTTYQPLT